ncbi:uncharacterized protein [Palaemon carinicauda]|uniref:uncharacterized protein n=1 Tax=Palaemon carinicauda TaxID=392227 RepID=UPI0035B5F52E
MKKFQDESGWLRTAVCCAVLLTQYGIRDSLLTALPNIANTNTDPEVTDTTLPEATTVSSNDSNSEDYIRANLESKSNYFQRKKHERKSSKEFEFDNLTRLGFQGISERHSEAQRYLSQSLFWAKLGGRNARLAKAPPGDTRQNLEASSIFRRGKYMPFFFTDGNERDVFRRLLDYIRTGNERKREDVRAYVMGDEFHVPLPMGGQNSSGGSWSTMNKGIVLSSVYWGWLITALLANYVISKLGANLVIAISVSIGSLMGLLTHASSLGGPWVLLPFRIIFGAAQGFCYPAVVRLLQGIPESSRMVAGTLVFIGPSLGSCVGVGLGSLESWYISTYLLGSLAIPLIPLCFMVPGKNDEHEKSIPVTQVLKTAGIWACIIVYVANIFTFHTALVGLPFCITETLQITDTTGGVVLLSMILVVAIVIRVTAVLSAVIGGKIPLTVLNKRRIPVAIGKH